MWLLRGCGSSAGSEQENLFVTCAMALFHMLVVAILAEGTPLWDDNCDSCEAGSAFLQLELSKDRARVISSDLQASRYWFPTKSVDNNRSGQSSVSGPFPLHKPDTAHWELNVPGVVFHQVPMIDDKLNIYMGSDAGKIFSFDKYGAKRWEVNGTGTHCQDPSLFEGILYTACRDGSVSALDMMTGQLLWQRKICKELPFEHYSISVTKDHIFLPAGVDQHGNYVGPFHEPLDIGSPAVALLRREDGRLVWKANLSEWNAITGELTPCMLSDSVIFSGGMGSIFRVSLQNGSLIWKVDVGLHRTTNAQVSCTQDGKVFAGYGGYSRNDANANDRHVGGLYALDIETGDTLWTRSFPYRVYTPVAVGGIQGHAGTAIIVAMGTPGCIPTKQQRIILCGLWTPTPEPKILIAVCFNFHAF